ncbi:conjugal transfer protein [Enterococcus faecalis]|nr:conjugal transfer protein [Enterococcus faecalis]
MKVKHIGLRKKTTSVLWAVLVISILFGVYKNFTAIDQHTVHEEKTIETKVVDTHFISSYVEEFAKVYCSWEPTKEGLEKRTQELTYYLPENLQQLNQEMIRSDIPTKSIVEKVKIWNVEQLENQDYKVLYSVKQRIEEKQEDKIESKHVDSAFTLTVRTDGKSKITVLTNPVMASLPKKMNVKTEILSDDLSITAKTKEEIGDFLNTFLKAYPTANKTELLYYVDIPEIEEINKDYIFSEIKSINYLGDGKEIRSHVVATYLDQETKAILNCTYELSLERRDSKWIIVDGL